MYYQSKVGVYDGCGSGDNDAATKALKAESEQRRKLFERYANSLRHQGLYSLAGKHFT